MRQLPSTRKRTPNPRSWPRSAPPIGTIEHSSQAAEISGLPCKVVAAPRSLDGLQIPSNVTVETGLSASQCHQLVQRSRFSVVPLLDPNIAAGQVTVVESMRMNRPIIATHSMGTLDYIHNGESGILVPPQDPEALAAAMLQLWEDSELRKQYAKEAARVCRKVIVRHRRGARAGADHDRA